MNIDNSLEIRAQLTRRDENWKLIEVLKTNTIKTTNVLTAKLSEIQGEYYLLTAEIIGEKGEVLDTLMSKSMFPCREFLLN
ncbi:MAG: hypothetical protein Q7I94_01850 [Candidatus Contubernalis sp.]|nr:hypothetical protein [Candidatus Contubernalis sp.]